MEFSHSNFSAHSLFRTFLGKALHHLALKFINPLNLLLGEKLRIFLIILLADIQNLLAHLKATLKLLLRLGIRSNFILFKTRTRT